MSAYQTLETLELIATEQWGIITTKQSEREGLTRLQLSRMCDRGTLQRARRGVYFLPSVQYGPLTELRAAWVSLEPEKFLTERLRNKNFIAISHESAASVHGIGDLIPHRHTFSSIGRKQTAQPDIQIHIHRELAEVDVTNIDGLPVTTLERTLADLAAQKIERNYLATLATDALRKEGVQFQSLAQKLSPYAKH